jgi:putative ABC transport system permease protein
MVVGTTDPSTLASAGSGRVTLTSGAAFAAGSDGNVALLGSALATKNNLAVGGTFTVRDTTITVAGIFTAGNTFGDSLAIFPLATVQRLSDQPGAVTAATVQVDTINNLDATEAAIRSALGESADVVSQQDTSAQALEPLDNIRSISSFSLTGAVAAGAVIIFLTMLMIVRERRREIAVLKAIGAPNRKVVSQFVYEAVTFTSLAAVLGVVGGVIASNPITRLLVNTSDTSTQAQGPVGGPGGGGGAGLRQAGGALARLAGQAQQRAAGVNLDTLRASVGWDVLLYGLIAALVITVVGSMIPAWLIARVRPAEVLRGE